MGKPRDGQFDRHSGAGRGIKAEFKKGGHGKGNWGSNQLVYRKKGDVKDFLNEEDEIEKTESKVEDS
jgi:hypothetical protein